MRSVSAGTDTTEYESLFVGHCFIHKNQKQDRLAYVSLASNSGWWIIANVVNSALVEGI